MNLIRRKPLFFGENLTDEQCEALQLSKFGGGSWAFRKHLKLELALMQIKWHDYKILHPVVATYLYAHEYDQVFKRYYRMTRDHEIGKYIRGFKGKDFWYSNAPGAFIRGRQQADSMGIPYDFYISAAYNFLYIKKWKNIPRQNHLYAEDVIERVTADWLAYSRSSLVVPANDFFKNLANKDRPEFIGAQIYLNERLFFSRAKESATQSLVERGFHVKLPLKDPEK